MKFSFVTKGKYSVDILSKQKYLKCILLWAIDTWPMSLTPMIGDSGSSWKNKTSVRKKILLSHCQQAQTWCHRWSFLLVCDMFCIHVGMKDYTCKFLWRGRLCHILVLLLSLAMMMTYIRVKPWVFNRMKPVIVQVWRAYRLFVSKVITYCNYISTCTNHLTITLW